VAAWVVVPPNFIAPPKMDFPVNTGLEPMWAWCTLIGLVLLCTVFIVWYSDNDRYKR